jgi:hypothetical protein
MGEILEAVGRSSADKSGVVTLTEAGGFGYRCL